MNHAQRHTEYAAPRFTYGDYRQWIGDERWELIDGQAHAMAPAPRRGHQDIVTQLAVHVGAQLRGSPCRPYVAPLDVRLPRSDEPDNEIVDVVQPDFLVVCDPNKLDDLGCRGAPDFVVEVLSSSTAAHDQITKLALYEQHGVREYWLVHPTERIVTVYLRGDDGCYARPLVQEAKGTLAIAALPGIEVDWDLVLPPD